jgi:hypothetical protein
MSDPVYESTGASLSKGQVIRLEMGEMPVPWMVYGRWIATLVLLVIVVTGSVLGFKKRASADQRADAILPPKSDSHARKSRGDRRRRSRRRAA